MCSQGNNESLSLGVCTHEHVHVHTCVCSCACEHGDGNHVCRAGCRHLCISVRFLEQLSSNFSSRQMGGGSECAINTSVLRLGSAGSGSWEICSWIPGKRAVSQAALFIFLCHKQ